MNCSFCKNSTTKISFKNLNGFFVQIVILITKVKKISEHIFWNFSIFF